MQNNEKLRFKRRSLRERYEALWLDKIRRSPHFRDLVYRLREGESVTSVTRWLLSQERGELNRAGYEGLRKYVTVLSMRVQAAMADIDRRARVEPVQQAAVEEVLRTREQEVVMDPYADVDVDRASAEQEVKEVIAGLNSREILAYAYATQKARIERIVSIEKTMDKDYISDGSRNMDTLVRIAEAVRKWEVSEAMMQGKRSGFGPYLRAGVQEGMNDQSGGKCDVLHRIDSVDRILMREVTEKIARLGELSSPERAEKVDAPAGGAKPEPKGRD